MSKLIASMINRVKKKWRDQEVNMKSFKRHKSKTWAGRLRVSRFRYDISKWRRV